MDEKMPNNYVAELLKQIEDLKKKKALKERKLMKLKALKSIKKDKNSDNPQLTSNKKTLDCSTGTNSGLKDDNGNSHNSVNKDFSNNNCCLESASSVPPHYTKHSKSGCSERGGDKENIMYKKPDLLLFEDHKMKTSIKISNEFEQDLGKVNKNTNFHTENTDNSSGEAVENNVFNLEVMTDTELLSIRNNDLSSTKNYENIEQKVVNFETISATVPLIIENSDFSSTKNDENIEQKVVNFETISATVPLIIENSDFSSTKTSEDVRKDVVRCEIISASEPAIKVDCASKTFIPGKLSNDSGKSLVLSNSRSKSPDLLDDSFDCNMSILISSEEQVLKTAENPDCDFSDKEEIKVLDDSEFVNKTKNTKEIKLKSKSISSQLEISPPCSLNTSLPETQINQGIFNFPKFSTPSNVFASQCDTEKNKLDHFEDKCEIQISPCTVSDDADKLIKNIDLHSAKSITQKVSQSSVRTDKSISSQVNCILGNGLSSVLDAHYGSPNKDTDDKSSDFSHSNKHAYSIEETEEFVTKKRKLNPNDNADSPNQLEHPDFSSFSSNSSKHASTVNKVSDTTSEYNVQSKNALPCSRDLTEAEKQNMNDELDFDNTFAFMSHSNPFTDSQNVSCEPQSCSKISPQVTETVDGLIMKVCENVFSDNCSHDFAKVTETDTTFNDDNKINVPDSEILVIPETEGLGLYFAKDTEDFLETSTLSESCNQFQEKDNLFNTSLQSELRTPAVNQIVSAIRSSCDVSNSVNGVKCNIQERNEGEGEPVSVENKTVYNASVDPTSVFNDSLAMDTSFLEDDTQDLGNLKQVPYMSDEKVQENSEIHLYESKSGSNLSFTCSLYGKDTEPVIDAEIILFGDVKYAFLQQKTQVHVWRQEKYNKWIKIFCHQIEEVSMLSLNKMCISKDEDNLVVVMLLSNNEQCCLQFLLFERDARVIKLMENTHWLEERHSMNSVLLCGLDGLMFATAQQRESHEVSLHAFIGLKESPRLMTAVLGSTENMLCSLCKIDKLLNALMGVNDSMLYIWHILEARLVTAVTLHPHDYLPIKRCFWATVENGLIYFLTTCEGTKEFQVCQLLAANLATGFCQSAMTYSTQPSTCKNKMLKITKATYLEPFLVVAHSKGAFLWSVTEEYCCAALSTKSETTTVTISKDTENWGLVAVGYGVGCINCYNLN